MMDRIARWRRGAAAFGQMFNVLILTSVVLTLLAVQLYVPNVSNIQSALVTAAQNGARVAAIAGNNVSDVQQAVMQTLADENIPTTGDGQPLVAISTSTDTGAGGVPIAIATIQYRLPPGTIGAVFALLGQGTTGTWHTITVSQSYVDETFFGS